MRISRRGSRAYDPANRFLVRDKLASPQSGSLELVSHVFASCDRGIGVISGMHANKTLRSALFSRSLSTYLLIAPFIMVRFFSALGAPLLAFFQYLGEVVLLAADTFRSIFTHKLGGNCFLTRSSRSVCFRSSSSSSPARLPARSSRRRRIFQFNKLGMGSAVGAVVSVALCRELGPVLTALMVSRPRRRSDVGRDRDDESDRANRCACARWRFIRSIIWWCRARWP